MVSFVSGWKQLSTGLPAYKCSMRTVTQPQFFAEAPGLDASLRQRNQWAADL